MRSDNTKIQVELGPVQICKYLPYHPLGKSEQGMERQARVHTTCLPLVLPTEGEDGDLHHFTWER